MASTYNIENGSQIPFDEKNKDNQPINHNDRLGNDHVTNAKVKTEIINEHITSSDKKNNGDYQKVTICGLLEVTIRRAGNLINRDGIGECCVGGCNSSLNRKSFGLSDPQVRINLDNISVCGTSYKRNTLNPVWDESFSVNVCHTAKRIKFKVLDVDKFPVVNFDFLGQVSFPVAELVNLAAEKGFAHVDFKAAPLSINRKLVQSLDTLYGESNNSSSKFGWISISLKFLPADFLAEKRLAKYNELKLVDSLNRQYLIETFHPSVVPNTYFSAHLVNQVEFYQSAHQPGKFNPIDKIPIRFLDTQRLNNFSDGTNETAYISRSCWGDLYAGLQEAKHFICCVGWSINPHILLVREGSASGVVKTFGEILKDKAEKGVIVIVLVWDDPTSNFILGEGLLKTNDEEVVKYFKNTKVTCVKVPRSSESSIETYARLTNTFSHHQKCIIMDTKLTGNRQHLLKVCIFYKANSSEII